MEQIFIFPASATDFIYLPSLWQNCRRIFVKVLNGLVSSKPRELVVWPIGETTQSFQRRREWAHSVWTKFPNLPIQSFNAELGEVNLHLPSTSALIHPKPLLQPPQRSRSRASVIANYKEKVVLITGSISLCEHW